VKIEKGKRVRLRIKLTTEDGKPIEESEVQYIQGGGTMIPGLEEALDGLEAGASKSGTIPPERAFGSPEHRVEKTIPRNEFPEDAKLEKGSQFQAKGPSGQDIVLRVLESGDELVKAELVHPLADAAIEFEAEIVAVTDPSPPPLPGDLLSEDDSS
jgi:FKBP-type peptidyl-prolyl cis-trans isomerase SlyD